MSRSGRTRLRGERGQAAVLVALLVVVVATGAMVLVARLGDAVDERTRARTAADAAALAGVTGGRRAAESVAGHNEATIERYELDGAVVEVTVRVGRTRASARAAPDGGAARSTLDPRPAGSRATRIDPGGVRMLFRARPELTEGFP